MKFCFYLHFIQFYSVPTFLERVLQLWLPVGKTTLQNAGPDSRFLVLESGNNSQADGKIPLLAILTSDQGNVLSRIRSTAGYF